jgi:hypothetical protein
MAGSVGVSGVENLTKFINTISQLAVTTDITAEAGAMAFGRIANIMQEPIMNVDRMGAVVVDLGNKFATTESEITNFAERIAGAGKIAKLSTSNIFAIGSAMSSVGVEAEAGGTAVQKVLIAMTQAASGSTSEIIDNTKSITKNTEKLTDLKDKLLVAQKQQKEFTSATKESTKIAKEQKIADYTQEISNLSSELGALNATQGTAAISSQTFAKALGLTQKQFATLFKENPMEAFNLFVTNLEKSGSDAFKILDDLSLSDQRLIRGFLSLANAGDLLTKNIDVANTAWGENTALLSEAEKRYATTESQIQIAKNNLNDLGITIGSVLLPALNDMLKSLKPIIEGFAEFAKVHPEIVKTATAISLLVAAVGPLALMVSNVMKVITAFKTLGMIATKLPGVSAGIGGIVKALGPLMSNPYVAIVVAIIAVIGLLVLAWTKNWGDIQGKTKSAIDFIGVKFEEFKANIAKKWEEIKQGFINFVTMVGEIPGKIGTFIMQLPVTIAYGLGFTLATIMQWGVDTWAYLSVEVPRWINDIGEFFKALPGVIWTALVSAYNSIVTWGTNTWNYLKVEVPKWVTNIVTWIRALPGKIAEALSNLASTVKTKFTDTWNGIVSEVSSWPGRIADWGRNIGNAFVNGIKDALNGLKDAFINGFNNAKGSIQGNSPPKEGPLKDIDKWGFNIGTAWVDGLTEAMSNFKNNISNALPIMTEPAYATVSSSSGVASGGFKQDVTINIDKVQNQQDVDALGREFGFRQSLLL